MCIYLVSGKTKIQHEISVSPQIRLEMKWVLSYRFLNKGRLNACIFYKFLNENIIISKNLHAFGCRNFLMTMMHIHIFNYMVLNVVSLTM